MKKFSFKEGSGVRIHFSRLMASVCVSVLVCALSASAEAQDVGAILRGIERDTEPHAIAPLARPQMVPRAIPLPRRGQGSVYIRSIRITGSSHFDEATLQTAVRSYLNRKLTLTDLESAASAIAEYYRSHDLLARAWLPEQKIIDGVLTIRVLEGCLGQVEVDPSSTDRLSPDVAKSRILHRTASGAPLEVGAIEEGVAILNETPGIDAIAMLKPGRTLGETDVLLQLKETPRFSGLVQADNGGIRSVGNKRVLGRFDINNGFRAGDRISTIGVVTRRSKYARFSGSVPVHESGLTLDMNASVLRYTLGDEFADLDAGGYAWTGGVNLSYPLRRSPTFSLSATTGYEHKRLVSWLDDLATGDSRIDAVHVGANGTLADNWLGSDLGPGVTRGYANVVIGHVGLTDNGDLSATDRMGAKTEGSYSKFEFGVSRLQKLTPKVNGFANLSGQWAGTNLDSAEKFSLGGLSGVRAYPQSEGSGDSGFVSQWEVRGKLPYNLELSGFYDVGMVRLHRSSWDGWRTVTDQPNQYVLQGVGLGLQWTPMDDVVVRGLLAQAVGGNPGHDADGDDSDGLHRRPRVWFSAALAF